MGFPWGLGILWSFVFATVCSGLMRLALIGPLLSASILLCADRHSQRQIEKLRESESFKATADRQTFLSLTLTMEAGTEVWVRVQGEAAWEPGRIVEVRSGKRDGTRNEAL